jgi:hypothetical protein
MAISAKIRCFGSIFFRFTTQAKAIFSSPISDCSRRLRVSFRFLAFFFGGPFSCYKQNIFFNKDIINFV